MRSGIYMIINLSNNKSYVGSSKNLNRRKRDHFNELKSNTHENAYLQNSYNKYGKEMFVFITLEKCSEDILINRELYWIDIKQSTNRKFGYNLCLPTEDGGYVFTDEIRLKMSRAGYERIHGKLTDEEFEIKRKENELYKNRERIIVKKKVFGFDKYTGELIKTYESVGSIGKSDRIRLVLDNPKYSYKGLILIKEENYDSNKVYKQLPREKKETYYNYEKKGRFKGHPVETFDLTTGDTVIQFKNKHEMAIYYNKSLKYIDKVFSKDRPSLNSFGVRFT